MTQEHLTLTEAIQWLELLSEEEILQELRKRGIQNVYQKPRCATCPLSILLSQLTGEQIWTSTRGARIRSEVDKPDLPLPQAAIDLQRELDNERVTI